MCWNALLKLSLSEEHRAESLSKHIKAINHTRSALGSTPLQFAVISENLETFHLLLRHTENTNAKNDYDETALHWACKTGNATFIKLLISHGADINSLDSENNTPLHWAAEEGHLDIVKLLKNHGAIKRIRNANNHTYQDLLPAEIRENKSLRKRILHH